MRMEQFLSIAASYENFSDFVSECLIAEDVEEEFHYEQPDRFTLEITITGKVPRKFRVKPPA